MGRQLDYELARQMLDEEFPRAEQMFLETASPEAPDEIITATKRLFSSATQAFREALIGVAVARATDREIDIRFPYMNQAENSFNGRTLDNRVVNPFLVEHEVPCSTGPYLSSIRRNVTFEEATVRGVRDKGAFRALLEIIGYLQDNNSDAARHYLRYLLSRFVALRDASNIALARVRKLSLEQHAAFIEQLLNLPSGGLTPVLLSVAILSAVRDCFGLPWAISWQGINVADRASGAGGDITIAKNGTTVLTIEVTERPIDRARVVATFNGKISPAGLDDYLFLFAAAPPSDDARRAAQQFFAQGHDVSFVSVRDWIVALLATIGPNGRSLFFEHAATLFSSVDVPAPIKLGWNERIRNVLPEAAQ
jgi:hypothetical protein